MRAHLLLPALGLISLAGAFPLLDPTPTPLNLTERCVDCSNPTVQPDLNNAVPSCAVCRPQWPSISSCAAASSVFKDASQIMWSVMLRATTLTRRNPLLFVSVIKCACIDTFRSAYVQCVDCFIQARPKLTQINR